MLELASKADLINAVELFLGISLRYFSKFIEVTPSGPTIVGITFDFVFHSFYISILRS